MSDRLSRASLLLREVADLISEPSRSRSPSSVSQLQELASVTVPQDLFDDQDVLIISLLSWDHIKILNRPTQVLRWKWKSRVLPGTLNQVTVI